MANGGRDCWLLAGAANNSYGDGTQPLLLKHTDSLVDGIKTWFCFIAKFNFLTVSNSVLVLNRTNMKYESKCLVMNKSCTHE